MVLHSLSQVTARFIEVTMRGGFASGLTEVMVIAGSLVRFDQIVSNSVTSQIQQVLGASA
ncbi:hypothetical protein HanPSC8_Chr04g0168921 [Helianthus annuus]|nr:hypothetical protein HanPSC8_Chr04g0168921 [Helianthus annuus]